MQLQETNTMHFNYNAPIQSAYEIKFVLLSNACTFDISTNKQDFSTRVKRYDKSRYSFRPYRARARENKNRISPLLLFVVARLL